MDRPTVRDTPAGKRGDPWLTSGHNGLCRGGPNAASVTLKPRGETATRSSDDVDPDGDWTTRTRVQTRRWSYSACVTPQIEACRVLITTDRWRQRDDAPSERIASNGNHRAATEAIHHSVPPGRRPTDAVTEEIYMDRDDSRDSTDDEESNAESTENTDDQSGEQQVSAATRKQLFEENNYQCQICGRGGPERDGRAALEVHHAADDPDGIHRNNPGNLTLLCRLCHNWNHQRATREDAPVDLSEADLSVLSPHDIEILRFLADEGPAKTAAISEAVTPDLSGTTIRERLALLMGLDNTVSERDEQIVDQDSETGEFGLVEQITNSARGRIPSSPGALVQRVEDEQVKRALERGCNRQHVAEMLDISRRTTFHKKKRARALAFPLDTFRCRGNDGQHPAGEDTSETAETTDSETNTQNEQRQLDADADTVDETSQADHTELTESPERSRADGGSEETPDPESSALREQLQIAIKALQQINQELQLTAGDSQRSGPFLPSVRSPPTQYHLSALSVWHQLGMFHFLLSLWSDCVFSTQV